MQDRRHLTMLPVRHHSRFPRMSQPPVVGGINTSDSDGRYGRFSNPDLHEQDKWDPLIDRLEAGSDGSYQHSLSPPIIPQSKSIGLSKTLDIKSSPSSSITETAGARSELSTGLSQSQPPAASASGETRGVDTNPPAREGLSTAFGGLVTTTSGASVTANPGTIFSPRADNSGSRAQFHAPLEPEVIAKLDDVFFKFLQRICSDLNACDAKGDLIHQPLMAKKMERLEASTDFRPFKFRIQAFTNAFHESLIQHGLTEDVLPLRKIKLYLWKHRYISRFNEDGKKQKSKGNHVWNIEARKISNVIPSNNANNSSGSTTTKSGFYEVLPPDIDPKQIGPEAISAAGGGVGIIRRQTSPVRWEFREYSSRIAGQVIKFARVGVPYVYSPRIWDAQMSCPAAKFSSPWLPSWLKWHRGELKGIPSPGDESCTIVVVAEEDPEEHQNHPFNPYFGDGCVNGASAAPTTPAASTPAASTPAYAPASISATDNSKHARLTELPTDASSIPRQLHQQNNHKKNQDEEMVAVATEEMENEDENMDDIEIFKTEEGSSRPNQNGLYKSHPPHPHPHLYPHHPHLQYQQGYFPMSAQDHQYEQHQTQQWLQNLHIQESRQNHPSQQPYFQLAAASLSADTTTSINMRSPSSRGSLNSHESNSVYIRNEESNYDDYYGSERGQEVGKKANNIDGGGNNGSVGSGGKSENEATARSIEADNLPTRQQAHLLNQRSNLEFVHLKK
ncbi:hypothetical protein FBU30_009402 [Linnemannia zychae]|nr:hypothetical protein FBU30_009402 [Linnemannia zychae]